ncbi:hypothetical protein BKA70DRAFT_1316267 [Coprinopsis sp. MPI-PUGE-AT-0042]|nr:hypothetical protein BKA70DRAFT_1316267 [Coprinopsis sp. MPI-PUGE-AT-0042]
MWPACLVVLSGQVCSSEGSSFSCSSPAAGLSSIKRPKIAETSTTLGYFDHTDGGDHPWKANFKGQVRLMVGCGREYDVMRRYIRKHCI